MVRFETIDGSVPITSEFDDEDSNITLPIAVPPDLSPQMLRLLSDCQAATREKLALRLERYCRRRDGEPRDVLISTSRAAAVVRGGA